MVLPKAAGVRVQTAMNGLVSTRLCPADRYTFVDTDCASSVVTDFCETNFDVKYFESVSACCLLRTSVRSLPFDNKLSQWNVQFIQGEPNHAAKLQSAPEIGTKRLSYHETKHSSNLKFQKRRTRTSFWSCALQLAWFWVEHDITRQGHWPPILDLNPRNNDEVPEQKLCRKRKILRRNETKIFRCRQKKDYDKWI